MIRLQFDPPPDPPPGGLWRQPPGVGAYAPGPRPTTLGERLVHAAWMAGIAAFTVAFWIAVAWVAAAAYHGLVAR